VLVHADAHVVEQPHDGVDGARPPLINTP
jgi:hypothetical protein